MPKGPRGPSEQFALDEEQINALWKACHELEDRVLVGLLLFEGMRVGEAVHLRRDWVSQGVIRIPTSMPCGCLSCLANNNTWQPKTKAGARILPVVPVFEPHLSAYLQANPDGLPISRIMAWKRVKRLALAAGIGYTSPHCLRASAATIFAKDMEAAPLAYAMGWSSISIASHYVNIVRSKAKAAEGMVKAFV